MVFGKSLVFEFHKMKKIVLIGAGKWGKNYISTIKTLPIQLEIASRHNWQSLVQNHPDGVIIATPPESHIDIAEYVMSRGIPTMIEKPLSLSLSEAQQLQKYSVPVLVNHIHLFSYGYQFIKEITKNKSITAIRSIGLGSNSPRNYSTLWDYGPHDLSLILDLLQTMPVSVKVSKKYDIFNIDLEFEHCKTQSTIGISNFGKTRLLQVECDGLCLCYDDLKRPNHHPSPLENAIQVFIQSIDGGEDNRIGLKLSMKVLQILEACQNNIE